MPLSKGALRQPDKSVVKYIPQSNLTRGEGDMSPTISAYGTWHSPIDVEMVSAASLRIGQTFAYGDYFYWTERRPAEQGRTVLVGRSLTGTACDITPKDANVRTAVHEYGGGSAFIDEGIAFYSNFADHRVYRIDLDPKTGMAASSAKAITKPGPYRYADFCYDKKRNRIIAIKEDHSDPSQEPLNTLDVMPADKETEAEMLLAGSDFFASPRISPDGRLLCWITWNHPNMPWDESKLWTGNLGNDGSLSNMQCVAGGKGESVAQPEWGPDGALYFVSDKSGWWNLHASYSGLVEPLVEMEAEFCQPPWVFRMDNYKVLANNKVICTYTKNGRWYIAQFDPDSRELTNFDLPYQGYSQLQAFGDNVVFIGSAPDRFSEVVVLDTTSGKVTVIKKSSDLILDPGYISLPEPIEFPTEDGLTAHAFYYPAKNKDYLSPEGEKPPLIVHSHGGPTGACGSGLSLDMQYWTSRGFSIVDVNYGGSTGYGRKYRERLNGKWGIVDVDDCCNAAKFLSKEGKADANRLAISGGSAGGYTTLGAITFRDTFKAGASYYGVSDLEGLATDTHKFESRYLDGLIGRYPEDKAIYDERSPAKHAEKIKCPAIFFQGLEDKVVPPSQSECMVNAMRKNGLPVAYLTYEGEQHGFRKADSIQHSLRAELSFYCRVFGINRSDLDPSLKIENEQSLLKASPS